MANDVRLIDANKLLEELKQLEAEATNKYYQQGLQDAITHFFPRIIEKQPTIDAHPVKLGKWVDYGSGVGMYCSECRHRIRYRNGIRETTTFSDGEFKFVQYASKNGYYNFCPKCGADMRGGDYESNS